MEDRYTGTCSMNLKHSKSKKQNRYLTPTTVESKNVPGFPFDHTTSSQNCLQGGVDIKEKMGELLDIDLTLGFNVIKPQINSVTIIDLFNSTLDFNVLIKNINNFNCKNFYQDTLSVRRIKKLEGQSIR